jgi:hypothetical protein
MINPCIVAKGPFEVPQGQSLTLRYRVVTFDGALPDRLINDLSKQFRAG